MRAPTANPVLRRELLERWRGRRAATVLTLYLLLLVGLLLLLRTAASTMLGDAARGGWGPPASAAGPLLGRFLFDNTLGAVLGLVLFVAPGYAAAQIAGERERRTLGLLRITLVRPRSIVLGKLGAASAWIVLLVIASAPVAASAFVLGGASVADLVAALTVILVVAVSVAAIAIGISSRARRTTGAVVTTYAVVLALVVGTLVLAFGEFAAAEFDMREDQRPVSLRLNPFYALADASGASTPSGPGALPSILTPFAAMLPDDDPLGGPQAVDVAVGEGAGARLVGPADEPVRTRSWSVWPLTVMLYLGLATAGLAVATRSIGPRDDVRET